MSLIGPGKGFKGSISLAGDKSISHRLILFSLLHHGSFKLRNLSACDDVKTSLAAIKTLGATIDRDNTEEITIRGPDKKTAAESVEIFCGNSGTTARLLSGILAGLPGRFVLTGDNSLSQRPMQRIADPLSMMGAEIKTTKSKLPIEIIGQSRLNPITYQMPVASAQVKSAILVAATRAAGTTTISEPSPSRDHSEILLAHLGAKLQCKDNQISLDGPFLSRGDYCFNIPADVSSAAFFVVAALLIPQSEISIENVLLNPTRTHFLQVLKRMGANIQTSITANNFELTGTIKAAYSPKLQSTDILPEEVPALIDEIPAISTAMAFAKGVSTIKGAQELRVKESDRIKVLCEAFRACGIKVEENDEGYSITGTEEISSEHRLKTYSDHRMAAAFSILALKSKSGIFVEDLDSVKISFPEFFSIFLPCFNARL
ncbi:MAG: 3-phosphoshikimate 1-carboxyvinyltransferase [Clostridiales bacterium]|jgi:3-phosphoshikimate 1-carboxyvinyltransferase|nr:3-phosphoshikimate 1-carboxyvinyltransferase [Clostridiales bacterium]MDN5283047.1 3-phosphoshikimate 1-carboxyvinyltransferase [Candidatus Ozemobacter sp.]